MKSNICLFLICMGVFCKINAQTKDTFEDPRDGKIYKTIQIGSLTWMAENLAFKVDTGCLAYNNDENHVAKYGRLYTFETAVKVCPSGWHLPSLEEFEMLIRYAGTSGILAYQELIPTGITGFNAVFGGLYNKNFQYIGKIGYFWSSTTINAGSAYYLGISSSIPEAGICTVEKVKNSNNKKWGLSVRCVKD